MGCFVYVLLGTCKDCTIGSTAVASLMTYQFAQGSWQRSVLLTFLTGFIELLMAVFRLGYLVEFVSGPVSAGFTSAVALIVCTSQMKYILGVNSDGVSFLQRWISMIGDIGHIRVADSCLGFGCVALLLAMRALGRLSLGAKDPTQRNGWQRAVNHLIRFVGISRNATVVLATTVLAMQLEAGGRNPFVLTGYIPPGLPTLALPPFSIEPQPGNATAGIAPVPGETFLEMVHNLGYGLLIVPLIALLENASVCKAFAKGKHIDMTQELMATGVANIANSLFSGYRSNSGLARSAINNASGCRTSMSNLYIGLVVVLALSFLTEYFCFIPRAVLAAILISAVIFQVQYQIVIPMWRSKRESLAKQLILYLPSAQVRFSCRLRSGAWCLGICHVPGAAPGDRHPGGNCSQSAVYSLPRGTAQGRIGAAGNGTGRSVHKDHARSLPNLSLRGVSAHHGAQVGQPHHLAHCHRLHLYLCG